MKYRVKLTCEDYYDYVRTHPNCSFKDRVKAAAPIDFNMVGAYNIKAKVISGFHRWYRISFSVNMKEQDFHAMRKEIRHYMEFYCHGVENFSWKVIKKGR